MRSWLAFCTGMALLACILLNMPAHAEAKAKWSDWQSVKQVSYYDASSLSSGCIVAVDIDQLASKKRWMKGSKKFKRTHFYRGEVLTLVRANGKHKGASVKVKVLDCGDFNYCGQHWKKAWRARWFDVSIPARNKLGITPGEGVGLVKWR